MKKLLLSLMLMISVSAAFATQPGYEDNMKGLIMKLNASKSVEALQACANGFMRVGEVEKEEWLPNYYAGMCYILQAGLTKDGAEIDAKLDKADEFIKKAMDLTSNDELLCLSSWSKSSRIAVNPMTRGQKYGMESAMVLQRALNLNNKNPRAHYLKGMSLFYTPEQFGGGQDKALVEFQTAYELFRSEKPKSEIMPDWGKTQNEEMINKIENKGNVDVPGRDLPDPSQKKLKETQKK